MLGDNSDDSSMKAGMLIANAINVNGKEQTAKMTMILAVLIVAVVLGSLVALYHTMILWKIMERQPSADMVLMIHELQRLKSQQQSQSVNIEGTGEGMIERLTREQLERNGNGLRKSSERFELGTGTNGWTH